MKRNFRSIAMALLVVVLASLPDTGVLAKSLKSLTIYQKVQLNDVVLNPGDYKVEILENGKATEVAIYKGKKLVVKATAQAVQQSQKIERTSVLYLLNGDETPLVSELRLTGEAVSYQFDAAGQLSKKKSANNT